MSKNQTTVYLIGAGPGDPQLISEKGILLLRKADLVLYDFLVHPNLLHHCAANTLKICVGKQKGKHSKTQDEIHQIILKYSKTYKNIVRLKGGTPGIFGRCGDEMSFLKKHNIAYEVIPGINSGIASAELMGIPLTYRKHAHSVAFLTGSNKEGLSPNLNQIPKADTLVIFMGITNLRHLIQALIKSTFYQKNTPIAIIQNASTYKEKYLLATLDTVVSKQNHANLNHPAIIIVGKSVELHQQLNWVSQRPLYQKRIHLPRQISQSQKLYQELSLLGADVSISPAIECVPIAQNTKKITSQLLKNQSLLLFTSANSVNYFFQSLKQNHIDFRSFSHCKIVSIGKSCSKQLLNHGIYADIEAFESNSEGVIKTLKNHIEKEKILYLSAFKTRGLLEKTLPYLCTSFSHIPLYQTKYLPINPQLIQKNDWIIFSSASIVDHVSKQLQNTTLINCICYGKQSYNKAKPLFQNTIFLDTNQPLDDLTSKIKNYIIKT